MIDLKTLKQLVKLMVDNELTEVDLQGDSDKVRLRRPGNQPEVQYVQAPASAPGGYPPPAPAAPAAPAAPTPGGQAPAGPAPDSPGAAPGGGGGGDLGPTIDSPMVGTFYTAASPDADAFVQPGDKVNPETVVCIIEAMKVFNEIKAETSGTIEKMLVENGDPVEFGQPLFQIKPA